MGCSQSLDDRIHSQEMYVNDNLDNVKQQLSGYGYTDSQIKGKLRQEYNGNFGTNDYVTNYRWEKVKM